MSDTKKQAKGPLRINVVIDEKHFTFDQVTVTGKDVKEKAAIPQDFSLYRRQHGSNEPISDGEQVELHQGDRFFSRPPSNVS
jgi:hypothetical protein